MMLRLRKSLFFVLIGLLFAVTAEARTPSSAVQEKVGELGFRIGAETEVIPGRLINERTWVDKRHIIVPGTDDRSYLVRFYQSCQGTKTKRMIPRSNKKEGQITRYDRYAPTFEGQNIAVCQIWNIYELESI